MLKEVADKFKIEIDGLDQRPHDLWAKTSLPQVTATEALSLLLVQFDSTFEFVSDRARHPHRVDSGTSLDRAVVPGPGKLACDS